MLRERVIYAGETPLASSIRVAVAGPRALVVRAGVWTTTGQARVVACTAANRAALAALVAADGAEWLADGVWARVWQCDAAGQIVERARTYQLAGEVVLALPPPAAVPRWARGELGLLGETVTARLAVRGAGEPYAAPAGWRLVAVLVEEFALPAGAADLAALQPVALAVRPGFPPGTTAADWRLTVGEG